MDTRLWIGALAERTGVSTHLLRVWEERYGLLTPERSPSGYRIYGPDDERRVREMVALRDRGMAAGDAAAMVLAAVPGPGSVTLDDLLPALGEAIAAFDEPRTHAVIDRALAGNDAIEVVDRLFFACLRRLGDEWESGEITVAQEHFGSGLIRGRMLALAPHGGTAGEDTPVAVLACPTHERHDIGLLALGLALRHEGWSVTFLGADTPVPDVVTPRVTSAPRWWCSRAPSRTCSPPSWSSTPATWPGCRPAPPWRWAGGRPRRPWPAGTVPSTSGRTRSPPPRTSVGCRGPVPVRTDA